MKVYDKNLQAAGDLDLNPKIFEIVPDAGLIEQAVRMQMANSRQAIAHTKTRGEVRGGGKKPWKQKGTGNARAGSIRSPIWRHGGITFGPRSNRNYSLKMNQKQWRKALYMVLSDKASSNNFLIFSELELPKAKTREMSAFLENVKGKLAGSSKKFLFVIPKKDETIEKSARNLRYAKVIKANSLNVVDLINYDSVILPKTSIEIIEKTYLK